MTRWKVSGPGQSGGTAPPYQHAWPALCWVTVEEDGLHHRLALGAAAVGGLGGILGYSSYRGSAALLMVAGSSAMWRRMLLAQMFLLLTLFLADFGLLRLVNKY